MLTVLIGPADLGHGGPVVVVAVVVPAAFEPPPPSGGPLTCTDRHFTYFPSTASPIDVDGLRERDAVCVSFKSSYIIRDEE